MKKKIFALVVSICLIFGGMFMSMANTRPIEAKADVMAYGRFDSTSSAADVVGLLGYVGGTTGVGAINGAEIATGKLVIRFDLKDIHGTASQMMQMAFSLDDSFGTHATGNCMNFCVHESGTMLDASFAGSVGVNNYFYGESATAVGGNWINTIGMDKNWISQITDINFGWRHSTIWLEADIANHTLQTYYGYHFNDATHAKYKGVKITNMFTNFSSSTIYYPTMWMATSGNTSNFAEMYNFTIYHENTSGVVDKTYASTDFSSESHFEDAWPFDMADLYFFTPNGFNMTLVLPGDSSDATLFPSTTTGVRVSGDNGVRFITEFDRTSYDQYVSTYGDANVKYGHVAISRKALGTQELTVNTANAKTSVATNYYSSKSNYSAVIKGIPVDNYGSEIVVRPYLKYGSEYVYGPVCTAKFTNVSNAAFNDRSATKTGAYIYQVATNNWSCYSDSQRSTLQSYFIKDVSSYSFAQDKADLTTVDYTTYSSIDVINSFSITNSAHIKLLGRTHYASNELVLQNSGTGFEVSFTGSSLTMTARGTGSAASYAKVWVDGGEPTKIQIPVSANTTYTLASGLKANVRHTVKFAKITEPDWGDVVVNGFTTDGSMLAPLKPNKLRFEVYGDSISCGYGMDGRNEDMMGFQAHEEDVSKTYAWLAAEYFNADINNVSHQGWGVFRSYWDPQNTKDILIPSVWDKVSDKNRVAWDFNNYAADVVFIYLGTNEAVLKDPTNWNINHTLSDGSTTTEAWMFYTAYVNMAKNIRAKYPNAPIICLSGMMETYCKETSVMNVPYIVNDLNNVQGVGNCHYLELNYDMSGGGAHPSASGHEIAASRIIALLKTLTV